MIFPVKQISIKLYNARGEFAGYSNLIHISKKKTRLKEDIEGATKGIFQFKVKQFKDGYKISKNPIIYK